MHLTGIIVYQIDELLRREFDEKVRLVKIHPTAQGIPMHASFGEYLPYYSSKFHKLVRKSDVESFLTNLHPEHQKIVLDILQKSNVVRLAEVHNFNYRVVSSTNRKQLKPKKRAK